MTGPPDDTGRNEAERALAESEERFRLAFMTSPDAFSISRVSDGTYVAVNPGFSRLFGWSEAEAVGRSALELGIWLDPGDRARWVEKLRRDGHFDDEVRFRRRSGEALLSRLSARTMDVRGVPHVLAVVKDVTRERLAEEERKRLEEELRQAQKMEAIGKLAGGVAHDFNNLLTAISANVGLALSEARPDDPLRPLLDEIEDTVRRATGVTRQLLAFSRRQPIEMRWTSLNALVTDLRRLLGRLIGEDVRLEVSLAESALGILADRGLVEQVAMNLILNARDAIGPGGRILVETREALLAGGGDRPEGRCAILAVHDDGHGMDEETRRRIFEPFFTTKESHRGTGLGLATVYGIVRQHGGTVEVSSEPGRGSTFEVVFPLAPGEPPEGMEERQGGPAPRGEETLLLVEDEANVREPTRLLLERLGYRVIVAPGGAEAIGMAAALREEIHLLLTDVVMPGIDGATLARRLRGDRPGIRVLFVSGYNEGTLSAQGFEGPALHLLAKPYTADSLAARVREILDAPPPRPPEGEKPSSG